MTNVSYSLAGKRVWVAGQSGMVGAAIVKRLQGEDCEVLGVRRSDIDLRRQADAEQWIRNHRPDAIFVAAAKVGGILANNSYPADFLYDNLIIAANIIHAAHIVETEKVLFLGSSCIYPKLAPQPIVEEALLTGPLEPTNEWYAIAKIAGVKLCQAYYRQFGDRFISAMPTNLYGPGDNFDLETSHVLPALIRKVHEAKLRRAESFSVWGTGRPRREFLFVDDCADALVTLMKCYESEAHVNVGYGDDVTIGELAEHVREALGFTGEIRFDVNKPDGTPQKLMDSSKLRGLGWRPKVDLAEGLRRTYEWYVSTQPH